MNLVSLRKKKFNIVLAHRQIYLYLEFVQIYTETIACEIFHHGNIVTQIASYKIGYRI